MKKAISLLLVFLLLCSVTVYAADALFSIKADAQNERITVTVMLREDITAENATMLQGELYYDPERLEPVSVQAADPYGFLTCVISSREPRVQFGYVSETSEALTLPAGTIVTAVFQITGEDAAELRLEMDLQTADGTVVADLTESASVAVEPGWENPFTDVEKGKFYYEPVLWAVKNGIVKGMTPTTFCPDADLQRAQVVVILWRAAGKPEPSSSHNPFTDVHEKHYYYKAVLWAAEEGITKGVTPTTFGPEMPTTRAQAVTFLWRYFGSPQVKADNPFTDVSTRGFYHEAVLWAVEEGITNGISKRTFGTNATCTRGHMVTFLYRALN